jgi:hypothetical protein
MDYTHQDDDLQAGWIDRNANGIRDDDPDVGRMRSGEVHELGHVFGLGHMAHKTAEEPGIMFTGEVYSCSYGFGWIDLDGDGNVEDYEEGYCNDPPTTVCHDPHPLSGTGFAFLAKDINYYCTQYKFDNNLIRYDGTETDFGQAEIVTSFAEYYVTKVFD